MSGHIFVIRGDVARVACDAWLLPTDELFNIESIWDGAYDQRAVERASQEPWAENERVRHVGKLVSDDRIQRSASIWLGNIGAVDKDASWYAAGAAAYIRAANDALPHERDSRPPLLALHHVGTGEGGARELKGDVLRHLFQTLTETLRDPSVDVDVVVVGWDAPAHAAAQRARMHALGGNGADALRRVVDSWPFTFDDRAKALRAKAVALANESASSRLAVFMGAGVSAGAGLPDWTTLLKQLDDQLNPAADAADLGDLKDPRDQAALLERRYAKAGKELREELARHLRSGRYSLQHGLLSSLPVKEFTTTNFDELFEEAAQSAGRDLRVIGVPRGDEDREVDRWLLKLHGTVSQSSSIVLTRASYLDAPRTRGALFGLVQAMLMTRHMLFVGYGLADEDFHELIHEVRLARTSSLNVDSESLRGTPHPRLGTALTLFEEPIHKEIWEDDVDVIAMFPEAESPGTNTEMAGREIELFLDLLGLLAADRTAFLLDPQYVGMLTKTEKRLATQLQSLDLPAGTEAEDAWSGLYLLLAGLGDPRAQSRHNR